MSVNQRFYNACENNILPVFNNLLYHGANVNFVCNGYTPLTISICNNHTSIYTELLNHHDIEINKKGIGGCTALHIACGTNNVQAIEAICADPTVSFNEKTHNGDTPLMLAIIDGHVEAVTKLVTFDQVDLEDLDYNERLSFSNGNIVHNFLTILGIIEETKQRRLRANLNLTLEGADEVTNDPVELSNDNIEIIDLDEDTDEEEDVVVDAEGETVKESIKTILHLVERVRSDILTKMLDYDEKKASLEEIKLNHEKEIEKLAEKQLRERQALEAKQKKQVEDQRKRQAAERSKAEQEKVITKQELEELKKNLDHLLLTPENTCKEKQPPCPNCPVCFDSLKPPVRILQCINGHLVCEKCRMQPQVEVCPTCREAFTGRATAMEQHLRALFHVTE